MRAVGLGFIWLIAVEAPVPLLLFLRFRVRAFSGVEDPFDSVEVPIGFLLQLKRECWSSDLSLASEARHPMRACGALKRLDIQLCGD